MGRQVLVRVSSYIEKAERILLQFPQAFSSYTIHYLIVYTIESKRFLTR